MESSLTPKYAENLKVKQSLPLTSRQDCCNVKVEVHKDKSDKQSLIHFTVFFFHLLTYSLTLDVSEFSIKGGGFSCCLQCNFFSINVNFNFSTCSLGECKKMS